MSNAINVLLVIGTKNQSTMMKAISEQLPSHFNCYFATFYGDGWLKRWHDRGWTESTIMSKWCKEENIAFCETHNLQYDYRGQSRDYDIIFTTNDLTIPDNFSKGKLILVQEGIIEPIDWRFYTSRITGLPRILTDTAMLGLSDVFEYFCVFSEGYKQEFIKRGVNASKILVTSAPNFDNVEQYRQNNFPYKDFVFVPTSNHRETKRPHDRIGLLKKVNKIANGRQIIFKLHPREEKERAIQEIEANCPGSLVYTDGSAEEMAANCAVIVASYSTVVLTAAALGKEIHCDYSNELLNELKPIQNNGTAAKTIANLAVELMERKS